MLVASSQLCFDEFVREKKSIIESLSLESVQSFVEFCYSRKIESLAGSDEELFHVACVFKSVQLKVTFFDLLLI